MKRFSILILALFIFTTSLFAETEQTGKEATLVLNFVEEKFLVGFSSCPDSIVPFAYDEIPLTAENDSTLENFTLKFTNNVFLYYRAVTNPSNSFSIKLSILNPLSLVETSNQNPNPNTINYKLGVNKVNGKWDGTEGTGKEVSSPTLSGSTYTPTSVSIGNIRAEGNKNYLVTGFAQLSITSQTNLRDIPFGTYKSTIKVSIFAN